PPQRRHHHGGFRQAAILARRRPAARPAHPRVFYLGAHRRRHRRPVRADLLAHPLIFRPRHPPRPRNRIENEGEDNGRGGLIQCRKCRVPVKAIAMPRASAAAMTSASFTEPPVWIAAVAPASAAAMSPSGNGKNASLQTTLPASGNFASPAFHTAIRLASTRLIWPAPVPSVRPSPT